MKEYHFGQIHIGSVNTILPQYAEQGWEVFWVNRNPNTQTLDFLLVRDQE